MKTTTITYDPRIEEQARSGWYLGARDKFVLKIVKKLTNLNSAKNILDAGCGTGGIISGLCNSKILIVGNDMSLESLTFGKEKGRITHGLQASITHLPFRDGIFDISICSEVLEHVEDDLSALKELCRVTKHRIVVTVPAHTYLWTDSDVILLHKRRYSKSELSSIIKKSNMRIVQLKPYGMILAFLVIFYKFFIGIKSRESYSPIKNLPLGSRFKIPRVIDAFLKTILSLDLWLSDKGLILWGHSWWACIEKIEVDVNINHSVKK